MKSRKNIWFSGPYLIWIVGFIVFPLLTIVKYAFTYSNDPFAVNNKFSLSNILSALTDPINIKALTVTLLLALSATLICFCLAMPIAIKLSKLNKKKRNFLIFIFILPMWMNFMLQMVAVNTIIENNGIINVILSALNLPNIKIANTVWAVLIGMVYDYFPFMLLPLYNTMCNIDQDLVAASKDLGASSFRTLFQIILPLSLPGIISGMTMVFIPAISDFAIAEMLGGGKIMLIGNIIEMYFTKGQYHQGSGLALILTIFVLTTSMIFKDKEENDGGMALI